MKHRARQAINLSWKRWSRFMERDFMKILSIYGLINIIMLTGFLWLQTAHKVELDLKPSKVPEGDDSFFPFAVMLLPLTLLLEDLGLRLLPWLFLRPFSRMDVEEKRAWRQWIYRHVFSVYVVVSALWHSFLHQSNVMAANPLGRLAYFGIQLISGLILAWIFIRKGFWESYTLHLSWDLLLIIIVIFSSLVLTA